MPASDANWQPHRDYLDRVVPRKQAIDSGTACVNPLDQ